MGNGGLHSSGIAGRLYNSEGDFVGAIEIVRDTLPQNVWKRIGTKKATKKKI
jgi:hypothetical protein